MRAFCVVAVWLLYTTSCSEAGAVLTSHAELFDKVCQYDSLYDDAKSNCSSSFVPSFAVTYKCQGEKEVIGKLRGGFLEEGRGWSNPEKNVFPEEPMPFRDYVLTNHVTRFFDKDEEDAIYNCTSFIKPVELEFIPPEDEQMNRCDLLNRAATTAAAAMTVSDGAILLQVAGVCECVDPVLGFSGVKNAIDLANKAPAADVAQLGALYLNALRSAALMQNCIRDHLSSCRELNIETLAPAPESAYDESVLDNLEDGNLVVVGRAPPRWARAARRPGVLEEDNFTSTQQQVPSNDNNNNSNSFSLSSSCVAMDDNKVRNLTRNK